MDKHFVLICVETRGSYIAQFSLWICAKFDTLLGRVGIMKPIALTGVILILKAHSLTLAALFKSNESLLTFANGSRRYCYTL